MKTTTSTFLFLSALLSTTLASPLTPLQSRHNHIQLIQRACKTPTHPPSNPALHPSTQTPSPWTKLMNKHFLPSLLTYLLTHTHSNQLNISISISISINNSNSSRHHAHDPRRRHTIFDCGDGWRGDLRYCEGEWDTGSGCYSGGCDVDDSGGEEGGEG